MNRPDQVFSLFRPRITSGLIVAIPWFLVCVLVGGQWQGALFLSLMVFISLLIIMRSVEEQSVLLAVQKIPSWIVVLSLIVSSALLAFRIPSFLFSLMYWLSGALLFASFLLSKTKRRSKVAKTKQDP